MNIQWYPGHMAKGRRLLKENLKLVDVVVELLDARIPYSSRNPDFNVLIQNKIRIFVLNKSDLADPYITNKWINWYRKNNELVVSTDSVHGKGFKELINVIKRSFKTINETEKKKNIRLRPIRLMVVGIPNVGKSAFINRIAGRASAKTGNKPGVTLSKQWIRINSDIQLLDMPGLLWPKFENQKIGLNLAFINAIKDEINDLVELAVNLLEVLKKDYPNNLAERYELKGIAQQTPASLLNEIGRKRGCIVSGGRIDLLRASKTVIEDFRSAKIGRISLERPELVVSS